MSITLNGDVLAQLAGNEIWPARLVELKIGDTTYRITDHYKDLVSGSQTYTANGNLLSLGSVANDIKIDQNSIEISLSAINSTFRSDLLDADAVGGEVTIYRGLISPTTGLLVATPITLYTGIIFSMSIVEDFGPITNNPQEVTFTATVEVRSGAFRLESAPGRRTNDNSQKQVSATDLSMEFVAGLNGKTVNFGG